MSNVISLDEFKYGKICEGCRYHADGCICGVDPADALEDEESKWSSWLAE